MIELMVLVALKTGETILKVFHEKKIHFVGRKQDLSPVTEVDLISNDIIITALQKFTPGIPILSEEEFSLWSRDTNIDCFWVIDPLDGTKEFLSHNCEFTVNIALIERGVPVMGVVYAPAMGILYAGMRHEVWKMDVSTRYRVRVQVKRSYPPVILISRFHNDYVKLNCYLMNLVHYKVVTVGSSLKFCLIAEGVAQIYPRFSPISVWDIAAGHAIAAASGAIVLDWNGYGLNYKNIQLSFLCSGFHVFLLCIFNMFIYFKIYIFIDY